ncbi:GNAT family N-acetyltransferase [Kineosporia babensis]|uniref:GNAT family N-acetyltransferase n=1 Tax=Kineosporia babensis TaxID=499548 RepID=A0A9X1SXH4_9ACTN|nr:GNAT family protein [Kineosporia babensis]MCD5315896.1 GNAT family N-acetyltransferase [Kineosporia babensis]
MASPALMDRARRAWVGLAGVPVVFPQDGGLSVGVRADSGLCPPGWVGVVVLGGAGIVTVPGEDLIGAFAGLSVAGAVDPGLLRSRLAVRQVLGPAALAYLDETEFRPMAGPVRVESLPVQDAGLAELLTSVGTEDAEESGLEDVTSDVFVVRDASRVIAAAGYGHWPGAVAHLCVLTVPEYRGRHLARAVASAATRDALQHRLLPQWRARPAASRRVAQRLGFRDLGTQLSLLPGTPGLLFTS